MGRLLSSLRLALFALALLFIPATFTDGRAQTQGAEAQPTVLSLRIPYGYNVWKTCESITNYHPGTTQSCVDRVRALNPGVNVDRISAGSTLSFEVANLPAGVQAAQVQDPRTLDAIGNVDQKLDELLSRETPANTLNAGPYLFLAGFLGLVVLVALVFLWIFHRNLQKAQERHQEELREAENRKKAVEGELAALKRTHEAFIKSVDESVDRKTFAPIEVILKSQYVGDGKERIEQRTFYISIVGVAARDGQMALYCKYPWGQYQRYRKRDAEKAIYENAELLGDLKNVTINFPENVKNLGILFEKEPPEAREILEREGVLA